MTEADWVACEDVQRMLELLTCELRYTTRRVPAFVAAFAGSEQVRALLAPELREPFDDFARWVEEKGPHPARLHPYLQVDSGLVFQHLSPSYRNLDDVVELLITVGAVTWLDACQLVYADLSQRVSCPTGASGRLRPDPTKQKRQQAIRLRDVVGPLPFRPVAFSPSWRTGTAVALAAQMYESRDFSAMPILADALQDAGCDSADVLDHCRGTLPSRPLSLAEPSERTERESHVRGCWVVDLVLGKE